MGAVQRGRVALLLVLCLQVISGAAGTFLNDEDDGVQTKMTYSKLLKLYQAKYGDASTTTARSKVRRFPLLRDTPQVEAWASIQPPTEHTSLPNKVRIRSYELPEAYADIPKTDDGNLDKYISNKIAEYIANAYLAKEAIQRESAGLLESNSLSGQSFDLVDPLSNYPPVLALPTSAPPFLIERNESELEKAEKKEKTLQQLMQAVKVLGKVDNYITSKAKSAVKLFSQFVLGEDENNA